VWLTFAAAKHTTTLEGQRNMAGVFYEDAQTRFGDVLRKLGKQQKADLTSYLDSFCKGKPR
jgi:hypothetical protein